MPNRGVAGNGFSEMHAGLMRPAAQRALDAAVLIPERDLEVDHALAMAVEAEMSGLDDARMHWSDGNLVDLGAGDREKIGLVDQRAARRETNRL